MSEPDKEAPEAQGAGQAANRNRSAVLGWCLGGMVVLVYLVTLVRLVRS